MFLLDRDAPVDETISVTATDASPEYERTAHRRM
jgi:hypothetical protein